MVLNVSDSLATLRSDYTGIWLWIHLTALALFLLPYGVFVSDALIATSMTSSLPPDAQPLGKELFWYILSAGHGDHVFHWGALLFVFGIVYNGLRGALLYKTHVLFLAHQISGLPLTYVLEQDRPWFIAYRVAKVAFWANVLVVLWHVWLTLSTAVVLDPVN
jgi:hypothetical protein